MTPRPIPSLHLFRKYQALHDMVQRTMVTMKSSEPKRRDYHTFEDHKACLDDHNVVYEYFKELMESYGELSQYCLDNDPHNQR